MIAYIKGILIQIQLPTVVVETHGLGYRVFVPAGISSKLPHIGQPVAFHTSFIIRELSQTIYGFFSVPERDFFESLMGVTGIGPKLALAMVGHMPIADLQKAIFHGDIPTICRIPGIGKKNAERLVVEMRDKIHLHEANPIEISSDPKETFHTHTIKDAVNALINLGYNQITAQTAIKKTLKDLPEGSDLSLLITKALSHI